MARSSLLVSAQVTLYINGRPYALVTGFRWDSATPGKAIYGLDCGEPIEIMDTITKITGSVNLLRRIGDGGLEGAGIIPDFPSLPRGKYFSMSLIEQSTDTQIFRADRCRVMTQSWDVPAKGRVTGQMAFEALDWNNEAHSK
jgi:hypothetical protein